MAKVLDWNFEVSEFELQSHCYAHFWTNTLRERYETPYHPSYVLNRITAVLLQEWLWH